MAEAENTTENQLNEDLVDQDLLDEDDGVLKPFGNLEKDDEGYINDPFLGRTKVVLSAPDQNQTFSKLECLNEVEKEEDERILADIFFPRQNYDKSFTQNGSVVLQAKFGKDGPVTLGTGFFIPDEKFKGKDTIEEFKSPNGGILGKRRKTRCILTAAHCVMDSNGQLADKLAIYVINAQNYESARVKEETEKKAGNTGKRFDRINASVRKVSENSNMKRARKTWKNMLGYTKVYVLPQYVDELKPTGSDIALIVLPKHVEAVFSDIAAVITPETDPDDVRYTCVDGYPGEEKKRYLLYKSGGFKEKGSRCTKRIQFSKSSLELGKPIGAIQYNCQTTMGQSGGCVKLDLGNGKYPVGAVHNHGVQVGQDGINLGTGENWGSLITTYVLDWIHEKQTGKSKKSWWRF